MFTRRSTYRLLIPVAAVAVVLVICATWEVRTWSWNVGVEFAVVALNFVRRAIELIALAYAAAFAFAAARYIIRGKHVSAPAAAATESPSPPPRAAVIYLCCNDVDAEAMESLSRFEYEGPLIHILHDDSSDPEAQRHTDLVAATVGARTGVRWTVLRRPDKKGGKAGAMNYVLAKTAHQHDLFLLADNDSIAHDPSLIRKAVPCFNDPGVAVVQFRSRAQRDQQERAFSSWLAGAIDMFDAFRTGLFEGMWQPFTGHNALLRTSDVADAGGFTPGVFADDIDLTVRLNELGRRVVYRRDLSMHERHPSNYRAFCVRAQKWAAGCAQVIRSHGANVLTSPRLGFREKLGFSLFCGFYVMQAAMVLYLAIVLLILPLLLGRMWEAAGWALVVGTVFPLAVFLPVFAYLATEGRSLPFWKTVAACAAVYGSSDLWTIRGLIHGFGRRERPWIPTNSVNGSSGGALDWAQFLFGSACLIVPWMFQPALLLFPVTWLFAAKFIIVPLVSQVYQEGAATIRAASVPRGALTTASCMALAVGTLGAGQPSFAAALPDPRAVVADGTLLIDGEPLVIKGVHYSPWPLGAGPGRGFEYPDDAFIARDLDMIASLSANTILVYDLPRRGVALAGKRGLNVIYTFTIGWWRLPRGEADAIAADLTSAVSELRDEPAIIMWMLGNEVPGWVIDALGADGVARALGRLRDAIRAVDPAARPVAHGNFPIHRAQALDRHMDLLTYNLYPFYPTEVAAMGYGRFIREQIRPLADGRPLLITEFGANTIEVPPDRQAEVIEQCWRELLEAGCQGGVVFAFADEPWKNYDNPISPPDWWRRADAPDDHLTHDEDPEEHYGIVRMDRTPKPAFAAVARMFGAAPDIIPREDGAPTEWFSGFGLVRLLSGIAVVVLIGWVLVARSRAARSRDEEAMV